MIIDTSALMAVIAGEPHAEILRDALLSEAIAIPAPALTELRRVVARRSPEAAQLAAELIDTLLEIGLEVVPCTKHHADIADAANARFGQGMGQGGTLNMLDLMVYAVACDRDEPLLCTGRDFAATDITIHGASRPH